eukprot:3667359-Pyramimonas_sp.AAC.1
MHTTKIPTRSSVFVCGRECVQKTVLFNCVAGRVTFDEVFNYKGEPKMIFMGEEFFRLKKKIVAALKLPLDHVKLTCRGKCMVSTRSPPSP